MRLHSVISTVTVAAALFPHVAGIELRRKVSTLLEPNTAVNTTLPDLKRRKNGKAGKAAKASSKASKGGKRGKVMCQDDDEDDAAAATASACAMFEAYAASARTYHRSVGVPGKDWKAACPSFESIKSFVCPGETVIREELCMAPLKPHLNPAVRKEYCEPLFAAVDDVDKRRDCENACVLYVSKDRGDCCDFNCDETI